MKNFIAVAVLIACTGQALSRAICTDIYGTAFCQGSIDSCNEMEMKINCRVTCNKCNAVLPGDEPAQDIVDNEDNNGGNNGGNTGGNTGNTECINLYGDTMCYMSKDSCDEDDMKVNCAKQCGTCGSASNPTPRPSPSVPCTNNWGNTLCRSMKDSCHETEVKRNCRQECNACNEDLPPATPRPVTATPRPVTTPTPTPAHDIPDEIRECVEEYTDFCENSRDWCHIEDVQNACPITCGLCEPVPDGS